MSKRRPRLLRCVATIQDGRVRAVYRWLGLRVDGHLNHDEDVTGWTDQQVRDLVADMIGADQPEDRNQIEVQYE